MSAVSPEALESANSQVMGLMLQQLKTVARHNGLPVSGPKATLQDRIKERESYDASVPFEFGTRPAAG